ncbi:unnamed protein product [Closterium sp. Yama58-4]|nr:unnamed protein product [Closterium sp. Yama58-4]
MFGPENENKSRKCKCCDAWISFKQSSTRSGMRHYLGQHNAHYAIWKRMYEGGLVPSDATFPEGGYRGVPHGGTPWPYADAYPNVPPEALEGGALGVGGGQGTMEQFMAPKLAKKELRAAIAKFVVMTDSSFRVVDTDAFKEMLTVANPLCGEPNVLPSRWTVARDVTRYADMARALARAELELAVDEVLPLFRVCFTTDIWSSVTKRSYMVVTAHWISPDWQLRQATLDFGEMSAGHTGADIAKRFEEVVTAWNLVGRCHGITTDNASNNDSAVRELSDDDTRFPLIDKDMWFRCMAHVLNLAVQKALAVDTVKEALKRIRDTATFVGMSPKCMERFRKELKESYPALAALKLVIDCDTRWGSTFAMVARALRLRRPLTSHFANEQEEKDKYASLRMTDDHWAALVALKGFLAPFNAITKAAEGSAYPTVTTIVPYYNLLLDTLEKILKDATNPPSALLRDLVNAALPVLQKHYDKSTDELTVATFLDPGLKMAYFAMPSVPDVAQVPTDQVLRLVRSRWESYHTSQRLAAAAVAPPVPPVVVREPTAAVDGEEEDDEGGNIASRSSLLARIAASVEGGGVRGSGGDEIDRYMLEELVQNVSPLEYWRDKRDMPVLKAMARDYLAIPASSAASERVFSMSRNLITWQRHRLSDERIRDAMTLRAFFASHPGVSLEDASTGTVGATGAPPAIVDIGVEGEGPADM